MFRPRFALVALVAALAASPGSTARPTRAPQVLTPDAGVRARSRRRHLVGRSREATATFAAQAGPDLLEEFDSSFVPAPSEVESFTVVLFDTNFRDILPTGRATD